jgi:hypothetical protein
MRTGRTAIRESWQEAIDSGVKGATLTTLEPEKHGRTVIEIAEPNRLGDYVLVDYRVPS